MSTNEQNYTKDYSLLRKFDLEMVKCGWGMLYNLDGELKDCSYVTYHLNPVEEYIFNVEGHGFIVVGAVCANTHSQTLDYVKMKPLAWVEGKPVYKGDVLWYNEFGFSIEVTGNNDYDPDNGLKGKVKEVTKENPSRYVGGELTWAPFDKWSWNKPKVKREGWINVYRNRGTSFVYETKEDAIEWVTNTNGSLDELYITTVRIEWEE